MRITETHRNGAEIGITGPYWAVSRLLGVWRLMQLEIEEEDEQKTGFQPNKTEKPKETSVNGL